MFRLAARTAVVNLFQGNERSRWVGLTRAGIDAPTIFVKIEAKLLPDTGLKIQISLSPATGIPLALLPVVGVIEGAEARKITFDFLTIVGHAQKQATQVIVAYRLGAIRQTVAVAGRAI